MFKKMTQFEIFKAVGNRFINDWKIPVSIGSSADCSEEFFRGFLDMLKISGLIDRWNKLVDIINTKFDGNPVLLLDNFYACREKLIQTVKNSDDFQIFNTNNKLMEEFAANIMVKPTKTTAYTQDTHGKHYLSIDLKSANFTALHFVNPIILKNARSYKEFVAKVLDDEYFIDYFSESKYCRQVIFGQLNPSRQITVEKYIIKKLLNYIFETVNNTPGYSCLELINSDEIVFCFTEALSEDSMTEIRGKIISFCQEPEFSVLSPDCFKTEYFTIAPFDVCNAETNAKCFTFYVKESSGNQSLKCIPKQYYYLIDALFYGKPVMDWMKHVYLDNMSFELTSSLIIKRK